jgi:outer membrane receptor protein involved in Fe transport
MLLICSSILLAQERLVIEEIIVTAQRMEESAGSVPIALNAFNDAMIEDRQIVALGDLQIFSPNLNYTTTNTAQMTFSVRGVGTLVSSEAESGISLHTNEVPLPPNQAPIEIFDVARIEVLRGPQGTLYGRNATGGVINIVTAEPSFDAVFGYLDAEAGQHDLLRLRGALNLPVSDSLAFRVAGLSLDRDGYTDNLAGGQVPGIGDDIDGRDLYGLRASAVWRISDRTETTLLYERFEEDDDRAFIHNVLCKTALVGANTTGCEPDEFGLEPANPSAAPFALTYALRGVTVQGARDAETGLVYQYPRPDITNLRDVHLDHEPAYDIEQNVWQLKLAHEFDWGEVALSGGFQEWTRFSTVDDDNAVGHELNPVPDAPGGVYPISAVPRHVDGVSGETCNVEAAQFGLEGGCVLNANLTRAYLYTDTVDEQEQWSAEIKLRTTLDGRVNFMGGVNYQSSKSGSLISHLSNEYDFANQIGGLGELGLFLRDPSPAFIFYTYPAAIIQETATEFDSVSAFGELYADLLDKVKLTLGLRYNRDEKEIADRTIGFADAVDLNSPSFANGALGPGAVWARSQAIEDPAAFDALRSQYGVAPEADPLTALLSIPIVPQINEQRLITGTPTKQTWDAWTGRAVLSWQATPQLMMYGSYSRGYKPGGFNPGTTLFQPLPGLEAPVTYKREDVNSFEVGAKGLFFEDSLSVRVAGFLNQYDDLQLANNAQRLSPGAINDNVDSKMYGAELELRWRPHAIPRAEFELGYAWLNATLENEAPRLDQLDVTGGNPDYVSLAVPYRLPYAARTEDVLPLVDLAIATGFANGPDESPAGQYPNGIPAIFSPEFLNAFGVETLPWILKDVSGNRIPEAPEHTLHLAGSYTWDVAGGALTARWDYYWQGDAYLTVFNRASHRIPSWDQHNATLVYEHGSGRWSARAWIKNIENDVHITGGLRTAFTDAFAVSHPRAAGASFRYNFGAR